MTTGLLEADKVAGAVDNIQPSESLAVEIRNMLPDALYQAWREASSKNIIAHPDAPKVANMFWDELCRRSREAEEMSQGTNEFGDF